MTFTEVLYGKNIRKGQTKPSLKSTTGVYLIYSFFLNKSLPHLFSFFTFFYQEWNNPGTRAEQRDLPPPGPRAACP